MEAAPIVPSPQTARFGRARTTGLALAALISLAAAGQAAAVDLPSRTGGPAGGAAEREGGTSAPASAQASTQASAPRAAHVAIKRGARGQRVMQLQRRLRANGVRVRIDGAFGKQTLQAVRRAQRKLGMRPTGVATPQLLRRLGVPAPIAAGSTKSKYLVAFPFPKSVKYRYFNDYHSPRGTGPHGATDVLAPHGAPIVAATHGVISDLRRTDDGLGGITIYIRDPAGDWYYYAHLSSISPGLSEGDTVWPGRVIGRNGSSGNASYGAPHLHFEIMKGERGGPNINPFLHLVAVDPKPRSQTKI